MGGECAQTFQPYIQFNLPTTSSSYHHELPQICSGILNWMIIRMSVASAIPFEFLSLVCHLVYIFSGRLTVIWTNSLKQASYLKFSTLLVLNYMSYLLPFLFICQEKLFLDIFSYVCVWCASRLCQREVRSNFGIPKPGTLAAWSSGAIKLLSGFFFKVSNSSDVLDIW